MDRLLSRDEFRTQTLARLHGRCVAESCTELAVDAHHILNRNLFVEPGEFGGYFLANGAGLCAVHHLEAEATLISCEYLWAAIQCEPRLPSGWDPAQSYDTWGNVVVSDFTRIPGPLYDEEAWRKLMKRYNLQWLFYSYGG